MCLNSKRKFILLHSLMCFGLMQGQVLMYFYFKCEIASALIFDTELFEYFHLLKIFLAKMALSEKTI